MINSKEFKGFLGTADHKGVLPGASTLQRILDLSAGISALKADHFAQVLKEDVSERIKNVLKSATAPIPIRLLLAATEYFSSMPDYFLERETLLYIEPQDTSKKVLLLNGTNLILPGRYYWLAQKTTRQAMREYGLRDDVYTGGKPKVIYQLDGKIAYDERHYPSILTPRMEFVRTLYRDLRTGGVKRLHWEVRELKKPISFFGYKIEVLSI